MNFIYVLFFAVFDFLIFSFLTKKISLNIRVRIGLVIFLFVVILFHFLNPLDISNPLFYYLFLFSLLLFVFHFGSKLAILIMMKINPNFKNHIVFSGFNFMRHYIIYVLVFVVQCISLFS